MKIGTRHWLAVMVLALLGAGCADEPQQAGQAAAVQPAKAAVAAPADDPVECDDEVTTGTMIHKNICYTASQKAQQQQDAAMIRDEASRPRP